MIGRIVEIASDGRYLSLRRGFLVVSHRGEEVGRTPIDDVAGLICNAHGLRYSNNVLVALAERGCPFVLCGAQHRPVGVLWPIEGHHRQAARMDAQIRATLPLRKRLWKDIVRSKIAMQAAVLELFVEPALMVRRWSTKVRAGDPGNVEGLAARSYWPLLLGREFRRDQQADGINACLNYGYAVLRATAARHLIASGLHPGIAIHHANEGNTMRLVDDVMEPFRPLVDAWIRLLVQQNRMAVDAHVKRALALLPTRTLRVDDAISPVTLVVQRMCTSLAQVYEGEARRLHLPQASAATLSALLDTDDEQQGEEAH